MVVIAAQISYHQDAFPGWVPVHLPFGTQGAAHVSAIRHPHAGIRKWLGQQD